MGGGCASRLWSPVAAGGAAANWSWALRGGGPGPAAPGVRMAGTLQEGEGGTLSGTGLEGRRARVRQQLQAGEGHIECGQLWHHVRVPGELVAGPPQLQPTALHQAPGEDRVLTLQGRKDLRWEENCCFLRAVKIRLQDAGDLQGATRMKRQASQAPGSVDPHCGWGLAPCRTVVPCNTPTCALPCVPGGSSCQPPVPPPLQMLFCLDPAPPSFHLLIHEPCRGGHRSG